jgi:hypothetical protein
MSWHVVSAAILRLAPLVHRTAQMDVSFRANCNISSVGYRLNGNLTHWSVLQCLLLSRREQLVLDTVLSSRCSLQTMRAQVSRKREGATRTVYYRALLMVWPQWMYSRTGGSSSCLIPRSPPHGAAICKECWLEALACRKRERAARTVQYRALLVVWPQWTYS